MGREPGRGRREFLRGVVALTGLTAAGCAGRAAPVVAAPGGMPPHPRLIADPATTARARAALEADERGRVWRKDFLARAEKLLKEPVAEWAFEPRRPVLLPTSRKVLERVQTLVVARGLTGDDRFAGRAKAELLAACGHADWNPSHFLDVAEMGHAAAIGYDGLFDVLDPGERALVRDAIAGKALRPGLEEFARNRFWTTATHNWNIVCNGGLTVAALAVMDEVPELAGQVLAKTLVSARQGFSSFAPDGGWGEGPGYWEYATAYAVYMLAALETAGVDDGGLVTSPGFAATGAFARHFTAPSGRVFNYADGGERSRRAPQLLWLARRFGRPADGWPEFARADAPVALDLLWYMPPPPPSPALDAAFEAVAVATFRGAWTDPAATWLAIKGGDNAVNHGNLDLGTFVLESEGERFAIDLGADDYALPGYFGARRHTYYRTMSVGQNALTLGDANQNPKARAPLAKFHSEPGFARAVVDLDRAYDGLLHRRGAALLGRRHAVIADEAEGAPKPLVWRMHTRAAIELAGTTAILRQGKARLYARILDPAGAVFESLPAAAPPPENPNSGVRVLALRVPPAAGRTRITVLLSPDDDVPPTLLAPARQPLATW